MHAQENNLSTHFRGCGIGHLLPHSIIVHRFHRIVESRNSYCGVILRLSQSNANSHDGSTGTTERTGTVGARVDKYGVFELQAGQYGVFGSHDTNMAGNEDRLPQHLKVLAREEALLALVPAR